MPQFDLANFIPQLAWLTLFFAILYFGIVRLTLPKIGRVVDQRETTVRSDIATAEAVKAQADRIRDGYETAMTAARTGAQASLAEAKASAARAVEGRLAAANEGLDATAARAEAALNQARQAALGEIERIAADAATDIVVLISGHRPDPAAALAAVRSVAA